MPSVLDALALRHAAATHAFSLCLGERTGLLLLGGRTDTSLLLARGGTISPMVAGSAVGRFTLQVCGAESDGIFP